MEIDVDEYKLYKTDWLQEPTAVLKNEEMTLAKAQIRAGDLLMLKSKDYTVASEQITVHLYLTPSGLPGEDTYAQDLVVPFDLHLADFRTRVYSLSLLPPEICPSVDYVRLRERTKTGHYGRIYREDSKSLKNLHISYNSEIVIQSVPGPIPPGLSLFLCIRDHVSHTTSKPKEFFFEGSANPTIDDMYSFAISGLGLDWSVSDVVLGKYVPHMFVWEVIEDQRGREERGTLMGSAPVKGTGGIYNLKKAPVNLKEGDMLVIRLREGLEEDDFDSEELRVRREAYQAGKPTPKPGKKGRKEKPVQILAK